LAREVRHHRADIADEDRWLSVAALRLWHQLEAASQTPEATTLPVVELSYGAAQQIKLDAARRQLEAQVRDQAERLLDRDNELADREALQAEVAELRAENLSLGEAAAAVAAADERMAEAEAVLAANEALAAQVNELTTGNQALTQLVREIGELRASAIKSLADSEEEHERLAQRYASDVRRLLIELDAARGEVESARSAQAEARGQADALLEAATALSVGMKETLEELARVDNPRQELIENINAIGNSQSWRLGYALTWPARVVRRSQRREIRSAEPTS
jgi:chromosome segregation ATPase